MEFLEKRETSVGEYKSGIEFGKSTRTVGAKYIKVFNILHEIDGAKFEEEKINMFYGNRYYVT